MQVEVIVGGIPSSCRGGNCSFEYLAEITPVILSISPNQGQGGTEVLIRGSGFGDNPSAVVALIGSADCAITTFNSSTIFCTASSHPAGSYIATVHVEGAGFARNSEDVHCFTYLLDITSISPTSGGIAGGTLLNVNGSGFFEFRPTHASILGGVSTTLPWFRSTMGVPNFEAHRPLNVCPSTEHLSKQFTDFLKCFFASRGLYSQRNGRTDGQLEEEDCIICSHGGICEEASYIWIIINAFFPFRVVIGRTPCYITRATVDHLECVVSAFSPEATINNVTVSVFDQVAILQDAFSTDIKLSPIIFSTTESGPVTGNSTLLLTGNRFFTLSSNHSDANVTIGFTECNVTSANETHIECLTLPHRPGSREILVSTSNGVAVLESALETQSLFPNYEYKLFVDIAELPPGSVVGGAKIDITGGIFVKGKTEVFFGDRRANILHIESDYMTVSVPSSVSTRKLHLNIIEGMYGGVV